jgi:hypothetical protein
VSSLQLRSHRPFAFSIPLPSGHKAADTVPVLAYATAAPVLDADATPVLAATAAAPVLAPDAALVLAADAIATAILTVVAPVLDTAATALATALAAAYVLATAVLVPVLAAAAAVAHLTVHAGEMAAAEAADEPCTCGLQAEEVAPSASMHGGSRPRMRTRLRYVTRDVLGLAGPVCGGPLGPT